MKPQAAISGLKNTKRTFKEHNIFYVKYIDIQKTQDVRLENKKTGLKTERIPSNYAVSKRRHDARLTV